jgi:hypothetical protein
MRVGILARMEIMGTNVTSQVNIVVIMASVAGSSEGVKAARSEGKMSHAVAAKTMALTNWIKNKMPAIRVRVRIVLIFI